MKKQYINPELTIVSISQQHQLLAGSTTLGIGSDGSANDAESRMLDIFDEDDIMFE